MASQTMKAVNYVGPHKVKVEEVSKPKIEHPDDIIVKVTTVSMLDPSADMNIRLIKIHLGCHLWL